MKKLYWGIALLMIASPMTIPEWLRQPSIPGGRANRGGHRDPAEKSGDRQNLQNAAQSAGCPGVRAKPALQGEKADENGLLQRIDPRIKLGSLIVLLILLSFSRRLLPILVVYAVLLMMAVISRLDMPGFFKRTLVPASFLSLLIILPAALNVVTPGRDILVLFSGSLALKVGPIQLPARLTVTYPGLVLATVFFARSLTMLTATMLVLHTTPVHRLFKAMAAFRLSKLAVSSLQMSYRYMLTLVEVVNRAHLARRSRMIRANGDQGGRHWAANRIAWTLRRSLYISEAVTEAMVSRGWTGDYKSISLPALTRNDRLAALYAIVFLIVVALVLS